MLTPKYTLNSGYVFEEYMLDSGEGHAPTYRERKPKGWTRLYHSDYLAVERKSYPIWHDVKLDLPLLASGAVLKGSAQVDYTNLISAKVIVSVSALVWPSWASLYLNGSKIQDFDFRLGSGSASKEIDVTSLILRGKNEFLFEVKKVSWVGWGTYAVTVDLVIEAETSSVSPPAPWEMWPTWWLYAAAGVGLVAVGGVILLRKR